jgi:hypothetical protein
LAIGDLRLVIGDFQSHRIDSSLCSLLSVTEVGKYVTWAEFTVGDACLCSVPHSPLRCHPDSHPESLAVNLNAAKNLALPAFGFAFSRHMPLVTRHFYFKQLPFFSSTSFQIHHK